MRANFGWDGAALLKAHALGKYRERHQFQHSGRGEEPINPVQIPTDDPERNRKVIAAPEASGWIMAKDGRGYDDHEGDDGVG